LSRYKRREGKTHINHQNQLTMKTNLFTFLITCLAFISLALSSTREPGSITGRVAVIQGYVYDSASNIGLEGVLVSAADISVTTDTSGFYFLSIETGTYDIFYEKEGYYTHIIPDLAVADTMNIDVVLQQSFVDFPFIEDWASGDFESNGWSFMPGQGNWSIDSVVGNPAPSVRFSGNPTQHNYSFELISNEIDTRYVPQPVWLQFDYHLDNLFHSGNEKLRVDIWNGQEWIQLFEFANTQYVPWTCKSIDVTEHVYGQFTRVRFVAHGTNSSHIRFWGIDNIRIANSPEISVYPTSIWYLIHPYYSSVEYPLSIFNNGIGTLYYNTVIQFINFAGKSDEQVIEVASMEGLSLSPDPVFGGEPEPSNQNNTVVLHYDGPNSDAMGLTAGGTFFVAARFPSSMVGQYAGYEITSVDVYIKHVPSHATLKIWGAGTGTSPGAILHQQAFAPTGLSWNNIVLTDDVVLDGADIWVGYSVTHAAGQFPAGVDAGPANPNGDWVSIDGTTWQRLSGFGLSYNWNIRANLELMLPIWLSIEPTSGSIAPGGSKTHILIINPDGLCFGVYEANVRIYSNDPQQPVLIVNFTLDVINNIDEPEAGQAVICYPVPAGNELYFDFFKEFNSLSIIDLAGSVHIRRDISNKTNLLLNTSTLPNGIYIFKAEAKDGKVYSRKIIISR